MRIEFVAAFVGVMTVSACGGTITGLETGPVDPGAIHSSGWASDPVTPRGRSRANSVDDGVPGTNCRDSASTVTVAGQSQVIGGTSCTLKTEFY